MTKPNREDFDGHPPGSVPGLVVGTPQAYLRDQNDVYRHSTHLIGELALTSSYAQEQQLLTRILFDVHRLLLVVATTVITSTIKLRREVIQIKPTRRPSSSV